MLKEVALIFCSDMKLLELIFEVVCFWHKTEYCFKVIKENTKHSPKNVSNTSKHPVYLQMFQCSLNISENSKYPKEYPDICGKD